MIHALVAAALTPGAGAPEAPVRMARCVIRSEGMPARRIACRFSPEGGGGFTLRPARGEGPLVPGVRLLTVAVVSPGVAEVSGLTAAGLNSRWGQARRSSRDPACWAGEDFSVCAYAGNATAAAAIGR